MVFPSCLLCMCPKLYLLIRIPIIALWPTVIPSDLTFTWLHRQRLNFQIKSHPWVPGVRTETYLFERHDTTQNRGHDKKLHEWERNNRQVKCLQTPEVTMWSTPSEIFSRGSLLAMKPCGPSFHGLLTRNVCHLNKARAEIQRHE